MGIEINDNPKIVTIWPFANLVSIAGKLLIEENDGLSEINGETLISCVFLIRAATALLLFLLYCSHDDFFPAYVTFHNLTL